MGALRTDGAARSRRGAFETGSFIDAESRPAQTGPWTPRVVAQLAVLAACAFIDVTAEILTVGALPAITRDLHVSVPAVGSLLAWYALVAAVTTVPLVRWTAYWPRRRTLLLAMICLTASQLVSAMADTFVLLACGRALGAITHGLILSVLAPIGARLLPAGYSGRATTVVYVGISLAGVVGSPLTAALSLLWGWRLAVVCVTVAAALITLAAWAVLPAMVLSDGQLATVGRRARHHRNARLIAMSLIALVAVTGHYISYTYIDVIIRDVVGVRGANLAWLLAAYGIAGLGVMPLVARPMDHRPKFAVIGWTGGLWAALALLTVLAFGTGPTAVAALIGTGAIALWGGAANAVSPMLQAAVMRTGADDPDGASALYMAAFQVGIAAGSLAGGVLYGRSVPAMLLASTVLMGAALAVMTANRRLFDVSPVAEHP